MINWNYHVSHHNENNQWVLIKSYAFKSDMNNKMFMFAHVDGTLLKTNVSDFNII